MIGNKIADQITKISKSSQQNISETNTNEHNKEIPKERYIYIHIYVFIYEISKKIYQLICNFKFYVFHNLQANEWCYYKHYYIKSNSLLLTFQRIAVNALFYNCALKVY